MDRLNELIDYYSFRMNMSVCVTIAESEKYKEMRNLLIELKQRRETELRPAGKFLNNNLNKQLKHVYSEFMEVANEVSMLWEFPSTAIGYEKGKEKALDELNDLQVSAETLKAIIEPDENKRRESMIRTIAKNTNRPGGSYYVKQP